MTDAQFCVYAFCRRDGTPFYIGKGTRQRIRSHISGARRGLNTVPARAIRRIWKGNEPVVEILLRTSDETEALRVEGEQIEKHKATLVNIGRGGLGRRCVTARVHNCVLHLPETQFKALKALAARNRRHIRQEVILALEAHTASL